MLKGLLRDLSAEGIDFQIAEARSGVRDFLRVEGLEEKLGHIGRFKSVADVLDEFQGGKEDPFLVRQKILSPPAEEVGVVP